MAIETVTPLDESFLRLESDAAHMHVGWVLRADGPAPGLEELRAHLAGRLDRVPRFRRRLIDAPFGLGPPCWVDDARFDIAHHVDELALPGAAGDAELRALAGTMFSARLSRAAPLWRMTLVTGLADGTWALVGQAHHALVDGIAAVQVAQLLFDVEPEPDLPVGLDWTPPPAPSRAQVAVRGAEGTARRTARLAGTAARAAAAPAVAASRAPGMARVLGRPAPSSALNRPISAHRTVGHADLDLERVRTLARATGVKLNDVVLAAAAMALAEWSRGRGEDPQPLKAMVPVNVREDGSGGELGNRISFLFVELPAGDGAPLDVLTAVRERTRRGKDGGAHGLLDAALDVIGGLPGPARGLAARLMARPETFNLVVSNVPGPPVPLYLLGRRLRAVYPAVPLAARHALSIGVLSYAGTLHAGLYADPGTLGDVDAVAADLAGAVGRLARAAGERVGEGRPVPAPVSPAPAIAPG
jgi:diacylglycerol O-acyltransferase